MTVFSNIFTGGNTGQGENVYNEGSTTDGNAYDLISVPVREDTSVAVKAMITARKSDGTVRASWRISALFYRNTGGDVTLEGNVQVIDAHIPDGCAYEATLAANTTNQSIVVRVTGTATHTVYWAAQQKYIRK